MSTLSRLKELVEAGRAEAAEFSDTSQRMAHLMTRLAEDVVPVIVELIRAHGGDWRAALAELEDEGLPPIRLNGSEIGFYELSAGPAEESWVVLTPVEAGRVGPKHDHSVSCFGIGVAGVVGVHLRDAAHGEFRPAGILAPGIGIPVPAEVAHESECLSDDGGLICQGFEMKLRDFAVPTSSGPILVSIEGGRAETRLYVDKGDPTDVDDGAGADLAGADPVRVSMESHGAGIHVPNRIFLKKIDADRLYSKLSRFTLRDKVAVCAFLQENAYLVPLLEQAETKIEEIFLPTSIVQDRVLELTYDREDPGETSLNLLIEGNDESSLSRGLDRLFESWWLDYVPLAKGKLDIDYYII